MKSTRVNELLEVRYPVLQGGMAWIADGGLAAAVSEAGGMGIIAAGNAPADHVRSEIRKARELTDRPFGVNVMLMSPFAAEVAEVVAEEKVALVTTGAGDPSAHMEMWKGAGVKVIPVVASAAMAKMMERRGADAVIAEGGESGGHVGDMTTMVLVPLVKDSVSIPVIAAGGIADGRAYAAALMLGAEGIQMGTRFLTCTACSVSRVYKDKVIEAKDLCTMVTGKKLGHPVRQLKNAFARDYWKAECSSMPDDELEKLGTGALRRAAVEGDAKGGCFLAGQVAAMVTKEESAEEILSSITAECEEALKGAAKWL